MGVLWMTYPGDRYRTAWELRQMPGETHRSVGKRIGVSRSRVGQMVNRYQRWLDWVDSKTERLKILPPTSIERLLLEDRIDIRTLNALHNDSITDLKHLDGMSYEQVLRTPMIGYKALREIEEEMYAHGLHMTGDPPWNPSTTSVAAAEFSVRAQNVLKNDNVTDLKQLDGRSYDSLLRLPNAGRRTVQEIDAVMQELGLHLTGEAPWHRKVNPIRSAAAKKAAATIAAEKARTAKKPPPDIMELLGNVRGELRAISDRLDTLTLKLVALTEENQQLREKIEQALGEPAWNERANGAHSDGPDW